MPTNVGVPTRRIRGRVVLVAFATGCSILASAYIAIALWGWVEFWGLFAIAALFVPAPLHFAVINRTKEFLALNLAYLGALFLVTIVGGVAYGTYFFLPSGLILLLAGLLRPTWKPRLLSALLAVGAISLAVATVLVVHVWQDVHHPPDAFSLYLDGEFVDVPLDADDIPSDVLEVGPFVWKAPGVVPGTITLYWEAGTSPSEIERMRSELLRIPEVEGVELCRRCRDDLIDLLA